MRTTRLKFTVIVTAVRSHMRRTPCKRAVILRCGFEWLSYPVLLTRPKCRYVLGTPQLVSTVRHIARDPALDTVSDLGGAGTY